MSAAAIEPDAARRAQIVRSLDAVTLVFESGATASLHAEVAEAVDRLTQAVQVAVLDEAMNFILDNRDEEDGEDKTQGMTNAAALVAFLSVQKYREGEN